MSYYDPYDLMVGVVADALEAACRTAVSGDDASRVDCVARYDFSGDPTKKDVSANKIVVRPDIEVGANRGDYPVSNAIGLGPILWCYHAAIEIEAFPIRTTKDPDEVRDITSKIAGRVRQAIHLLARTGFSDTTDDGHWRYVMGSEKLIQGGGIDIKDAGRTRTIKGEQRLIVGFIFQYVP